MSTTDKATVLLDGVIVADATLTRAGVFVYSSDELGLEGPSRVVRVLRPPEEVFAQSALDSLKLVPLTLDHPRAPVSPDTFDHSNVVGAVGNDVRRDGLNVVATVAIRSARALDEYHRGIRELSAGYTADYGVELEGVDAAGNAYTYRAPGVWMDQEYDLIQSNIIANHVAHVAKGRAGNARFNDSAAGFNMLKTTTTDSAATPEATKTPDAAKSAESKGNSERQTYDAEDMVSIELGGYEFEVSAGLAAAINMLKDAAGIKSPAKEPDVEEAPKPEELKEAPAAPVQDAMSKEVEALRKQLDEAKTQAVRDSVSPAILAAGQTMPKDTLDAVKLAIQTKLPGSAVDHLTTVDAAMATWRALAAMPVKDSQLSAPTKQTTDSRTATDDAWKKGAPSLAR